MIRYKEDPSAVPERAAAVVVTTASNSTAYEILISLDNATIVSKEALPGMYYRQYVFGRDLRYCMLVYT